MLIIPHFVLLEPNHQSYVYPTHAPSTRSLLKIRRHSNGWVHIARSTQEADRPVRFIRFEAYKVTGKD